MQNFTDEEFATFKQECRRQRETARANICNHPEMASCADYEQIIGPWLLRLYVCGWQGKPAWIGSVGYIKRVAAETIYNEAGLAIFEAERDKVMNVADWTPEELDVARELLGNVFGPLLHDPKQQVIENKGVTALSWIVDFQSTRRGIGHG